MKAESTIEDIIAKANLKSKKAVSRTMTLVIITVAVTFSWLLYSSISIANLNKEKNKLTNDLSKLKSESDSLKNQLDTLSNMVKYAIDVKPEGIKDFYGQSRHPRILSDILEYKSKKLKFNYYPPKDVTGLDEPEFNSPSFMCYILSQNFPSIPRTIQTYAELRKYGTAVDALNAGNLNIYTLKTGDIIFYPGGYTMMYFSILEPYGEVNFVAGLTPWGVQTLKVDFAKPLEVTRFPFLN